MLDDDRSGARTSCYFFVRPKKSYLEVCVFLGRPLKAPQVRRSEPSSKTKFYNIIQITHRDEVETPITDWLREAYDYSESATTKPATTKPAKKAVKKPKSGPPKTTTRAKRAKRD